MQKYGTLVIKRLTSWPKITHRRIVIIVVPQNWLDCFRYFGKVVFIDPHLILETNDSPGMGIIVLTERYCWEKVMCNMVTANLGRKGKQWLIMQSTLKYSQYTYVVKEKVTCPTKEGSINGGERPASKGPFFLMLYVGLHSPVAKTRECAYLSIIWYSRIAMLKVCE